MILIVVAASAAAPLISPFDPAVADAEAGRFAPIGTPGHLLGTDGGGRDILSRLIWGGRVSISIAVLPVLVSAIGGLVLGLAAGMTGKLVSGTIMRTMDVLFAFPAVLLALAVATVLGPGMMNVMLSIGIVSIPYMARVVYVETLSVRASDYIEAARVCGTPMFRLLAREIVPNVIPSLIVYATIGIGGYDRPRRGVELSRRGGPTADAGLGHHDSGRPRRPTQPAARSHHPGRGGLDRGPGLQRRGRWDPRCHGPPSAKRPPLVH